MSKQTKGTIATFTGIILLIPILIFSFTNDEKPLLKAVSDFYQIKALKVPQELYFAGERVPVEFIDVWESVDRELLINTYWQSRALILIKRANKYFPTIERILKKNGIPDDFKYLAMAESGLVNITSPANAEGYWQLLDGTATDYGLVVNDQVDERYHLEKSTQAACEFLKDSYERYGSWTMAAASYNMGRNGLNTQIDRQKDSTYYNLVLGDETSRYVFRILSFKEVHQNPEKYGFIFTKDDLYKPMEFKMVSLDSSVSSFADFASYYNTNYKTLKYLNPWLRDNQLFNPNNDIYLIKIPELNARLIK